MSLRAKCVRSLKVPDDLGELEPLFMRALKKACSHKQIVPSEDLNATQYATFLDCATSKELTGDIIFESTFQTINLN